MMDYQELEMPPCDAQFLAHHLFEIGPTIPGGMGEAPITHSEIEAFQRNTGIEFDSWQTRLLRSLSREYIGELYQAKDPMRPAPWQGASYAKSKNQLVADRMKAETRALSEM